MTMAVRLLNIVRLFSPALALMLLLGAAAPSQADRACRTGAVTQTRATLNGIPYLLTEVPGAIRTIVLLHGGPYADSLACGDPLDLWLAERYRSRVVKPQHFGSEGRSPWDRPLSLNLDDVPAKGSQPVLDQIVAHQAGMQRSVEEVRTFIRTFDGPGTMIIGESHGARLAVLAIREPIQGGVILYAPTLPSVAEFFEATLAGLYQPLTPPAPPSLVIDGVDRTDEVFQTPDQQRQFLRVVSLSYYHPFEDLRLVDAISGSPQRFHLILGGRDRVGMITGAEWQPLQGLPQISSLCVDPAMGHQGPFPFDRATGCMDKVMGRQGGSGATAAHAGPAMTERRR